MKPYEIPRLYKLGKIEAFVKGSGNGNMRDFYATTCDVNAPLTAEDCHNNPNSVLCQYFVGKGYVVAIAKDENCRP